MSNIFEWTTPLPYTLKQATDLGLAKGVIMRAGIMRSSGDHMSRENVYHGSGALRALAPASLAIVDIDHYGDNLPSSYAVEFGPEIAQYPQGHIIDCQAIDAADGIAETQAIMMIHAKPLRDAINKGLASGCSVVDAVRRRVCHQEKKPCEYHGSAFVANTIALKLKPDSARTWVKMIDASDIGTIITG